MEVLAVRRVRKKPVEVDAAGPLHGGNWTELAEWCGGQKVVLDEGIAVAIPTLEGIMYAIEGDHVIRGLLGEFYPIKEAVYVETYDVLE